MLFRFFSLETMFACFYGSFSVEQVRLVDITKQRFWLLNKICKSNVVFLCWEAEQSFHSNIIHPRAILFDTVKVNQIEILLKFWTRRHPEYEIFHSRFQQKCFKYFKDSLSRKYFVYFSSQEFLRTFICKRSSNLNKMIINKTFVHL